jgi:hypothetical protein
LQEDQFEASQRDKAICGFQNGSSLKSAVFVITLKARNVGMMFTAGSQVYLLEPCIDPAVDCGGSFKLQVGDFNNFTPEFTLANYHTDA